MNFVIACLRPSQNVKFGIFTSSRAVDGKEMYTKKRDARAKLLFCLFKPPPKFRATQIFWAARENLGKASF